MRSRKAASLSNHLNARYMKWIARIIILLASIALILPFVIMVFEAILDGENSFLKRLIND